MEYKTIKVDTRTETISAPVVIHAYVYRYAYARSADSRAQDEVGQDYLTFREEDDSFAFVLCDGVSQSYFGDLAAGILGDALLGWLGELSSIDENTFQHNLTQFLLDLSTKARHQVDQYKIPDQVSEMLREVLVEKRELGSETTFVCGRIDVPSNELKQGRMLIAWMGDSRLRFWGLEGERTAELGDSFLTEERWSTHRGLVNGEPHVFIAPLEDSQGKRVILQLMAYSDGLLELDRISRSPSNFMLQDVIERTGNSPTSDDISIIELWLGQTPANLNKQPSKKIGKVNHKLGEGDQLILSWKRVPGAKSYQVELHNRAISYWETENTRWQLEDMPMGENTMRVRPLEENGEPGLWSEPIVVVIEEPKEDQVELLSEPARRLLSPRGIGGIVSGIIILLLAFYFFSDFSIFPPDTTPTPSAPPTVIFLEDTPTQPALEIITEVPTGSQFPSDTQWLSPTITDTLTIDTFTSTGTTRPPQTASPTLTLTPSPTPTDTATPTLTNTVIETPLPEPTISSTNP